MSVQTSLTFFDAVRRDPALRAQLAALGPAPDLRALLELARSSGHACSPEDLHEAFREDWRMRWLHHGGR